MNGRFVFSSGRRHTILQGDWSSDVCSSDLADVHQTQEICSSYFHPLARAINLRRVREPVYLRRHPGRLLVHGNKAERRAARSEERRVGKDWRSERESVARKGWEEKEGGTRE